MIEVLIKSKEFLIVEDSELNVIYGNASKNTVIEYLSNLTPENGEEAMRIIMLIILLAISKYVIAKHIKVTTRTEVFVKTAKPSMVKTAEDALRIADKFGLKAEVQRELDNGATPLEALREWNLQ